jgi:hypothetical protein
MKPIHKTLCVICIVAIITLYYIITRAHSFREGYQGARTTVQGQVPQPTQASYIPRDSASATTANPLLAKPDYRDWGQARDSFNYFLEIYSPQSADASFNRDDIKSMFLNVPYYLQQIEAYIQNPEATPSRDILERGAEAQELANSMRRVGNAGAWLSSYERPGCISYINDNLMAP